MADAAPIPAHISPVPSQTSINHIASQTSLYQSRSQNRTTFICSPELDSDALFQHFNHELSLVPLAKNQANDPKVKQSWEYRVKEFSESNHLKPDGSNFVSWRKVQLVILRTHKWIRHAEGTDTAPHDSLSKAYDIWQTVDNLTMLQLAMNMDFDLYGELADDLDSAAELWGTINNRFSKKTSAARATAKLNLD
ncbi:hypothetical protein A7U60_g1841 [Sanghuangporus baumii]|uniref:Gag protein n=1 Tax=Sanghuangporus baumii TaxID=108892 RepID=A0A9Q5NBC9_SANBA|nr:hypothetical protein A7U60_g1841 [Sanghuangporus baumii]